MSLDGRTESAAKRVDQLKRATVLAAVFGIAVDLGVAVEVVFALLAAGAQVARPMTRLNKA